MRFPSHLSAWTRAALGAAGLMLAATVAAQAQSIPATAPTTATAPDPAPAANVPAPAANAAPAASAPIAAPAANAAAPVVAQGAPAPARRPAPAPTPFRAWYPVIDFVVTFTQPAYYNSKPAIEQATPTGGVNQLPFYDPMDLGGTIRIPVTRKINLLFDRITEGTINQPLERSYVAGGGFTPGGTCVNNPCVATYPRDTRDIILQYHATYTFDRFLTMDVGDSFRHRVYASGSGNALFCGVGSLSCLTAISAQPFPYTLASQEHHYGYLGFTYTTKPWKEFMNSSFALNETFETQAVDHHVAVLCTGAFITAGSNGCAGKTTANVGYIDERPGTDRYYTSTQSGTWIWPVDARRGVVFTLNERFGYLNWYENNPSPLRWNAATVYQLSKRFSPGFTLAVRHQDLHQTANGATFTVPNAIHVGSWDLIGTFHFDTKTMFGL